MEALREQGLVAPDAEVVLRVGGIDVAICAFFKREDGWGIDVLTGIDSSENAEAYASLFAQAGESLRFSNWRNHNGVPHDDPPF